MTKQREDSILTLGAGAPTTSHEPTSGRYLHIDRPLGGSWFCPLGGDPVTIGRAEESRIVLDERLVSRHHARIDPEGDGYRLRDLDSKNGTIVNGRPARDRLLSPGDVIEIGESGLTYREAAHATPPPSRAPQALPADTDLSMLAAVGRLCTELASAAVDLAVLERAVEECHAIVPCDRALVVLLEEQTGKPLLQFAHPSDRPEPDEEILRAGAAVSEPRCLRAPKRGAVIESGLGIQRHLILVPLEAPERRLGLFVLERSADSDPFPDEALSLATILAAPISALLRLVVAEAR